MGCQAEGWLVLAKRTGRNKQPRPDGLSDLMSVTDAQIDKLANTFKNLSKLRQELRPETEPKTDSKKDAPVSIEKTEDKAAVIDKAIAVLEQGELASDCLAQIETLARLAADAVKTLSPKPHRPMISSKHR